MLEGGQGQESRRLVGGSQRVRSKPEKRVTTVERRERRKVEVRRTKSRKRKPTRVPARASQRWYQPSAIGTGDTERLPGVIGDEAKSRSLSTAKHPPTGKPDAGEPPVRFGGRGGGHVRSPYPYRFVCGLAALRSRRSDQSGFNNRVDPVKLVGAGCARRVDSELKPAVSEAGAPLTAASRGCFCSGWCSSGRGLAGRRCLHRACGCNPCSVGRPRVRYIATRSCHPP